MNAIVAVDKNWAIGREGSLLFHIPEDLHRFKALTWGQTVLLPISLTSLILLFGIASPPSSIAASANAMIKVLVPYPKVGMLRPSTSIRQAMASSGLQKGSMACANSLSAFLKFISLCQSVSSASNAIILPLKSNSSDHLGQPVVQRLRRLLSIQQGSGLL